MDQVGRDNQNEIAVKRAHQEIRKHIQTLVNFSTFTESGEIGAITLKASSLIQMELNRSMR